MSSRVQWMDTRSVTNAQSAVCLVLAANSQARLQSAIRSAAASSTTAEALCAHASSSCSARLTSMPIETRQNAHSPEALCAQVRNSCSARFKLHAN